MNSKRENQLLRTALFGNAAFSSLCGIGMLAFAGPLALALGSFPSVVLTVLGGGLLVFAALLLHQATRPVLSRTRAVMTCIADLGWVLATVVLLVGWPEVLSAAGRITAIVIGDVVFTFFVLQLTGIRRLGAEKLTANPVTA